MKRYYEHNFLSPLFEKFRVLRNSIERQEEQDFTTDQKQDKVQRTKGNGIMPNFIVLDTETTGLDPSRHGILQVAGVSWNPETGRKEVLFDILINEGTNFEVDEEAMKVNRINLEQVRLNGYSPSSSVDIIEEAFKKEFGENFKPCVIAAQNAGFDKSFVQRLYKLAGRDFEEHFQRRVLDVPGIMYWLMLMGDIKPQYPNFNNFLNETSVFLSPAMAHTAKADAVALAEGLDNLYRRFKKTK